jgi:hypothetical protein
MPIIEWKTPSPLWKADALDQPRILELEGDNFLPDFLAMLAGQSPMELEKLDPKGRAGNHLKLYQPLHGRYYLVTGSLICHQMGWPDRAVARQDGEKVSFVVRRLVKGQEQGWANDRWQSLRDEGGYLLRDKYGDPVQVLPGEERFPLHSASVCPASTGSASPPADPWGVLTCNRRTIYYGYIPVGSRDKYLENLRPPSGDPAQDLDDYIGEINRDTTTPQDYRLFLLQGRVINPWRALFLERPLTGDPPTPSDPFAGNDDKLYEVSLSLILELRDFLSSALSDVYAAVVKDDGSGLSGDRQALYQELGIIHIGVVSGNIMPLCQAIREQSGSQPPARQYNLQSLYLVESGHTVGLGGPPAADFLAFNFTTLFSEALTESAPMQPSEELAGLLQDQVRLDPPAQTTGDWDGSYFLRLVYERPECPPVVSDSSSNFTFAKAFDPDAPARHIRIELPSIKLSDLRKYQHGVGLQMSPELQDIMSRVNKGMLKGEGLSDPSSGWGLGMICSFSLQIIFLVAFIVMFIFLIALNFVFWWLPFLKICFPIPKRAGS